MVLSEQCGSPTTQACLDVTIPNDISPMLSPDKTADCIPGIFTFTNQSTNPSDIQSVEYQISNGDNVIASGANPFTHTINQVGTFDVNMLVTSIYGCVYQTNFTDIVTVQIFQLLILPFLEILLLGLKQIQTQDISIEILINGIGW